MTTPPGRRPRRAELAEHATDHVLEHGLIGLSLRPLAHALGTSDRMLLYHFRDKDDLVATVLRVANDRAVAGVRALPAAGSPHDAVTGLWEALAAPEQQRCQRVYVEAAALGLLGRQPYASVVRSANAGWASALADHLAAAGLAPAEARRAVVLVDAVFMGLRLDEPLSTAAELNGAVADLATAVAGLQPSPDRA